MTARELFEELCRLHDRHDLGFVRYTDALRIVGGAHITAQRLLQELVESEMIVWQSNGMIIPMRRKAESA